jgi:ubiquinone/menaquinone biosynthesis C-methylase UbiE
MADNHFDAAYAIEATCHAGRYEDVYQEIFRTLKPGASFACYEWVTTEKYNPENLDEKKIISGLEVHFYY